MDRTAPTARVIDLARHRRPGYETDAPVAGLTPGELFPLSALRLWAAPHRQPQATHPDWREGFVLADIDDRAAAAFDAFMGTVLTAATAALDVRCPRCARLGADEAILLLATGHLQRRHPLQATLLLGRWMAPAAVRIGIGHLGAFARAAADADLWVPSCRLQASRADTAGVDPGLVRIH